MGEEKKDFVRTLLEFGADPNRATEGCEKTPIEIAMGVLLFEDGTYVHYRQNFEMLMILAGFVNAETPVSIKFDILKVILERDDKSESYPEQFKKNLMDLAVSEVMEKQLSMIWHLADPGILINWIQFAAARGKTDYVGLLLDHGLDPESHREGAPRAIELAAVNGHVDTFSMLAARLKMDSQNNEWFQLGQLLVLGVAGKDDEFKELLDSVPLDKVNKEAVCGGSTLLQDLARLGKTSAVVALLHHGVDPKETTETNIENAEIFAWRNGHLKVLVEMNKVMELQPLIMDSSLGMQVQRMEERAWRKKMEEKQQRMEEKQTEMVALLNQLISFQIRDSGAKAGQGTD